MGAPMARNLASAGFAVRVWNRTREKAEAVEGVEVADSPEGAASGAGAVITMLADASAVEEAMTGGEGALPALEGAPWLQMSTIGQKTLWVGEAGAGSRLKLVLNSWLLTLVEGVAEAVALASSIGVDPERFLEAIEGGPLGVPYADLKGRAMIADEFPPSFALALARKDAELVLEAAADLELPFARAVTLQLRRAEACGLGEQDMAAVARMVGPDRGATRAET